ncbi:hypothetical protein Hanom_Chr01g00043471 [Helianthus anomalus]
MSRLKPSPSPQGSNSTFPSKSGSNILHKGASADNTLAKSINKDVREPYKSKNTYHHSFPAQRASPSCRAYSVSSAAPTAANYSTS